MKYSKIIIALYCIILFLVCSNCYARNNYLADSGISAYKILVPKNATEEENTAAAIFQKFFSLSTGVLLPILNKEDFAGSSFSIQIGDVSRFSNAPAFKNDGVYLKSDDTNLIISGSGKRGVINAVSTFLENYLDIRYFALDEVLIPKKNNFVLPNLDYQYSSPFTFRSYYSLENADINYVNFQKQNYFFEDRLYPAHSFAWLLPASKYFQTNPEFFALIDGKRNPSQMCFSSKGSLHELIRVLKLEMAATPKNKVWSVSTLDSPNICHCNLCEATYKKGSGFSETLMPFVNAVARIFPDKIISTLAYNQSILPSKIVKPEKNVEIMFCFTNLDRRYTINDPKNLPAKKYTDALQLWEAQTNDIFIWDYAVNYFHSLSPFPNIQTFQGNLRYLEKKGVKKVFLQGIGVQKGEFSELKSYIASKLLWNPDADFNIIFDDFLLNYYGNGWKEVKQYILTLEAQSEKYNTPLTEYASPVSFKSEYLNASNINNYKNILKTALSKVSKNTKYYNRIQKELLAVEYADLEIQSSSNINSNIFNKKLNSFKSEAHNAGVKNLRNGELTVDEYTKKRNK